MPPTYLETLDPMAKAELLSIFSENFSNDVVPGIWKAVDILPMQEAGKPPKVISSCQPVSLTPYVVKPSEIMVHNRLDNLAETRG